MKNRIMSAAELIRIQQQTMRQEEQAALNLLWRAACVSTGAALDNIEARKDLREDEKDRLTAEERKLLQLAKLPKICLPDPGKDPIPPSRSSLLAFRNALEEALKKYEVIEKDGYFHLIY